MTRWMSIRKAAYLSTSAIILILSLLVSPDAFAASIEGNKCWAVHMTQGEDGPIDELVTVKTHAVKIDAATFIVTGRAIIPTDNPVTFEGTAILAGGSYVWNMTITQVQKSGKQAIGTARISMSEKTLKGNMYNIVKRFDPSTMEFDDGYRFGTIAVKACR